MKNVLLIAILSIGIHGLLSAQALSVDLGTDVAICASDTVYVTADVSGGTAPYTYSWRPFITLTCDTCQTVGAYPLVDQDLIVTVTDDVGATASDTIEINVITRDTIVLGGNIIQGGWLDSTNTGMLTIAYDISDTFPAGADWFVAAAGDSLFLDSVTTYVDTFDTSDPDLQFFCTGSPDNECSINVSIIIDPVDYCITYKLDTSLSFEGFVGVEEPLVVDPVSIYPNPANADLNIEAPEAINYVQVVDVSGKEVLLKRSGSADNSMTLDVSGLNQGLYFIRVFTLEGSSHVSRIVVE